MMKERVKNIISEINSDIYLSEFVSNFMYAFDLKNKISTEFRRTKVGFIKKKNFNEYSTEELAKIVSRRYSAAIVLFVNRLSEVKPNFDFPFLRMNLETLKVKNRLVADFDTNTVSYANYYSGDNKIVLSTGHALASIYHELFHMATRTITSDGYEFCGFSQFKPLILNIGKGLNEGYTELLTQRYFYDQGLEYAYSIEVNFAKMVEKIVGQSKMEQLFFDADLFGLQQEFIKDTTEEEFLQFICDLDYIKSNRAKGYSKELEECLQRAWNFLYLAYIKKQKRLLNEQKISYELYENNLEWAVYRINNSYYSFNEIDVWNCNKDKMLNELLKYGIEVEFYNEDIATGGKTK